jgi:hypothetical protein
MERRKRLYSIHQRPAAKHRHIYYVKFRDESGAYRTAVSSGCSRRDDTVRWARSRIAQEQDRRENITLAEYAHGFWKPEAVFAADRAAHGRALSRTCLDIAEGYTRNHLLPVWGGKRLCDLNARTTILFLPLSSLVAARSPLQTMQRLSQVIGRVRRQYLRP